jgi:glycosyltransferase involved in cell wall biosynthesis
LAAPQIAFDITPLQNAHQYRGIGTYVRGLARRLSAQSDVPIEFWGWSGDFVVDVPPPHRALSLRKVPMPQYRGAWLFAQLAMRRRAQRSAVNVVHITDPDALTPLGARRLLTTVYDLIPLKQPRSRRRAIAYAGYDAYIKNLRVVDKLFAISQQTASDLVELLRLPASRILVARPGVDLPPSGERQVRGARPYFLYIGGPNPNKNLGVVLDAIRQCTELEEELRVGGHWLPKQVEALDAQLAAGGLKARVRHVGFVPSDELGDLMRDATALIIPSLHEGFGLPVAEGMAAGAAVIHSDLPVLDETSAGTALTFDPHSAATLAAAMRRIATNAALAADLRARGRKRAESLTWDSAVETTLAAYRAALA